MIMASKEILAGTMTVGNLVSRITYLLGGFTFHLVGHGEWPSVSTLCSLGVPWVSIQGD